MTTAKTLQLMRTNRFGVWGLGFGVWGLGLKGEGGGDCSAPLNLILLNRPESTLNYFLSIFGGKESSGNVMMKTPIMREGEA